MPTPVPTNRPRRFPTGRADANDFGEAVADAWHRHHGAGRMDIPCGIVAALALWPHKSPDGSLAQPLADFMSARPAAEWPPTVAQVYAAHWIRRPDLMNTAAPIFRWTEEEHSEHTLFAIKKVAEAALRHGVLHHTGSTDPYLRSDIDLMSWTVTSLRHRADRSRLGEYHTPPSITDTMAAAIIGDDPAESASILDPAGGTGGMFRSAVQHLRDHRVDPHKWIWHLQEIDPIAAACAAANALVWDLGPNCLVSCGDTLVEGDLFAKTLAARRALETHRDELLGRAAVVSAIQEADQLVNRLCAGGAAEVDADAA